MAQIMKKFGKNASPTGRDFAVGDIHGCFSLLEKALAKKGFDESKDRLFSVGDMVDRGPESFRVVEFLDKPWFFAVAGNHEFLTWRSALGNPYPHVDHEKCGGAWLSKLDPEQKKEVGLRLRDLPLAMEVEVGVGKVGLVHADVPFDDWAEMDGADWSQADAHIRYYDLCLWSTERIDRNYEAPVKGLRALIHGHVVVKSPKKLGNVHFIETGGWIAGRSFTLLDLSKI